MQVPSVQSSLTNDLNDIHVAGERAARLTSQLLAFARRQRLEPSVLDLNDLVTDVETLLARMVGDKIDRRIIPSLT